MVAKTKKGRSQREILFELFDQGYTNSDPQLKNTGFTYKTRKDYYNKWKHQRAAEKGGDPKGTLPGVTIQTAEENLTPPPALNPPEIEGDNGQIAADSEESEDNTEEDTEEEEEVEEEPEENAPEKPLDNTSTISALDTSPQRKDGKRGVQTDLRTQGLRVTVEISVKTLYLYYDAANRVENLTLGDFIDECVEDFYKGRGLDLGLITLKIPVEVQDGT